jgi:hypothetical protein
VFFFDFGGIDSAVIGILAGFRACRRVQERPKRDEDCARECCVLPAAGELVVARLSGPSVFAVSIELAGVVRELVERGSWSLVCAVIATRIRVFGGQIGAARERVAEEVWWCLCFRVGPSLARLVFVEIWCVSSRGESDCWGASVMADFGLWKRTGAHLAGGGRGNGGER